MEEATGHDTGALLVSEGAESGLINPPAYISSYAVLADVDYDNPVIISEDEYNGASS